MTAHPPFAHIEHALPPSSATPALRLAPMTSSAAHALAEAFAASEPWSRYPVTAHDLTSYLAADDPGAPRFLIASGDEPIGALGLRSEWLRGPYIQFLGILQTYRSAGIGARLLTWTETEARRAKARNIWVCTSAFNVEAQRFYSRAGFTPVTALPDLLRDGIDEILLRKRLT